MSFSNQNDGVVRSHLRYRIIPPPLMSSIDGMLAIAMMSIVAHRAQRRLF